MHPNSGRLWGARLLSLVGRRPLSEAEGTLARDTHEAHARGDRHDPHPDRHPGIHALAAWRRYNARCAVEQRIEELRQLSVGRTAVDDLGGNRLLWSLGGLACQLLHELRTQLSGAWRRAQPKRLRAWLLRVPGRWTAHGEQWRLDLPAASSAPSPNPRSRAARRAFDHRSSAHGALIDEIILESQDLG